LRKSPATAKAGPQPQATMIGNAERRVLIERKSSMRWTLPLPG
jgi:hypothetical protein